MDFFRWLQMFLCNTMATRHPKRVANKRNDAKCNLCIWLWNGYSAKRLHALHRRCGNHCEFRWPERPSHSASARLHDGARRRGHNHRGDASAVHHHHVEHHHLDDPKHDYHQADDHQHDSRLVRALPESVSNRRGRFAVQLRFTSVFLNDIRFVVNVLR